LESKFFSYFPLIREDYAIQIDGGRTFIRVVIDLRARPCPVKTTSFMATITVKGYPTPSTSKAYSVVKSFWASLSASPRRVTVPFFDKIFVVPEILWLEPGEGSSLFSAQKQQPDAAG